MQKKITLLFLLMTSVVFAQVEIASSNFFTAGAATAWPYVFTAATSDDPNSQSAQTLEINITSLPAEGANYRVYKTTANGGDFFGNPQSLALGPNTLSVTAVSFSRTVRFQFSSGAIEFDAISLNNSDSAQGIASSNFFTAGSAAAWPYVFTAATSDDPNSQSAQTLEINITSLPADGANYRVFKTTANGGSFFGNPQPLTFGLNTLNVTAVSFNRAVKFQFSTGDIEFDEISLNSSENDLEIATSDLFTAGSASAWPYVFTATTSDDPNSQSAQTLEINITSLPAQGANYRVYKTTANGGNFFGNPQPLTFGINTLNVAAVSFPRTVKFQFSSGDIDFGAMSLNGSDVLSLEDINVKSFVIYPNPAKDMISISGATNIHNIKVFSILGTLEKEFFNTNQVDISELSSGIHFIKINDEPRFLKKIIKY